MNDDIEIVAGDDGDSREIERSLLASLREALPQATNRRFVLCARTKEGRLVAGATFETSYGWAAIKTLWVAQEYRRRGLARALMLKAEMQAIELGCHGAWLDTSNPQARAFYEALGYRVFGSLENGPDQLPQTHRRWFLNKALADDG
ncbi:GNAT family N-acetyltransferase [Hoeflea sp.]|uniref:GNAT family N-acetyltransferase n=1 Tax=Hoeflea sp. TaxID=1940281 RepID=UPI003B02BDC8